MSRKQRVSQLESRRAAVGAEVCARPRLSRSQWLELHAVTPHAFTLQMSADYLKAKATP